MFNKFKHNWKQIAYTAFTVILLCSVIISMIGYIYKFSEEEAFEKLHLETQQIKSDINLQMISDRENLLTMANFASKLYSDGENFDLMFRSFEKIGLIENIGILLPDNSFVTKVGTVSAGNILSFAEEVKKGEYISGRVKDITNPNREVVRTAVPIKVEEKTVAILYGVIELNTLEKRYSAAAKTIEANLYVLEGNNGNFIVDTKYDELGNVASLATRTYGEGFSYDKMIKDLTDGVSGYSAFRSQKTGEYNYVHYAPLEFSDWRIMLSQAEQVVFAGARATERFLMIMFFMVIVIMLAYLLFMITAANKKSKINVFASAVRKRLLGLNRESNSINNALEDIATFAKSRSAFFVDTLGEDRHYISDSYAAKLLEEDNRLYFIRKLMSYVTQHKKEQGVSLQIIRLVANKKFSKEMPEFYEFLKEHEIKVVHFAGVTDNRNTISLIGVVNPKNDFAELLIKDIAVCFSMAVYNKKHLVKTEAMALTDSLTGLANRMAYKRDVKDLNKRKPKVLACVYIDVNELHYFNNKYGHAAGDQMLAYIAEVMKKEFSDSRVYRMGGDEYLVFAENIAPGIIEQRIVNAKAQIEEMKYHISVGVKYLHENIDIEELVNEAEKEMYTEKAEYYQEKELTKVTGVSNRKIETITTGIKEVDACLSVMSMRYQGVYSVCLNTDKAVQILAPTYYFMMPNEENKFSDIMKQYIHDIAKPEFQRTLMSFIQYDVLERQLKSGHNPMISYTKVDGERVMLSVYLISDDNGTMDTLWVFEKEMI